MNPYTLGVLFLKGAVRALLSIPIIPTIPGGIGWLRNRWNRKIFLCSFNDLRFNVSDTWHFYSRVLPEGTRIVRDSRGKVIGYIYPGNNS